jgi:hypothetical protein
MSVHPIGIWEFPKLRAAGRSTRIAPFHSGSPFRDMIRVIKPASFQMKTSVTKKGDVVFIWHGPRPLHEEKSFYDWIL